MKKNVGDLDAFFRITSGLSLLGFGIKRDYNLLMMLGAMKVAEGVTRFCPVLYVLGKSSTKDTFLDIY